MVPETLEREFELVVDLVPGAPRQGDYARLGETFDPRRHVYPITEDVSVFGDEAWSALADVRFYTDWDREGVEAAFRSANELNPSIAMNHFHYAWLLLVLNRYDEAVAEHELAYQLDPFKPFQSALLGWAYLYGRESEQTKERMAEVHPYMRWMLGVTYARAGRTEEARQIAREIEAGEVIPLYAAGPASLYGALGNVEATHRWLTHEPNHAWRVAVAVDLIMGVPQEVITDPIFEEFMARLDLPWWKG